ncbi:MAG: NAD-dependent epimerase [Rhodothermia bacterium]
MTEKILVTGAAGFIGYHLCERLLKGGATVVGLDDLNNYYSIKLKKTRVSRLQHNEAFRFVKMDLSDNDGIATLFVDERFDRVVNLAAQAGVRYSLENPHIYLTTNMVGFVNVLEGCRRNSIEHLVYASSSSVYGSNMPPWSVDDRVDHPLSLYAATKKSNELLAHSYGHLFGLKTTGLRFFTVYGPWGRPDSAYYLFADAIYHGRPVKVFNEGRMQRDFTFIDDIVSGVERVIFSTPKVYEGAEEPGPGRSATAPYRVYNIGNDSPVGLLEFIETIENCLGMKAERIMLPMQLGDIKSSHADVGSLARDFGFKPSTRLADGMKEFIDWYREYQSSS